MPITSSALRLGSTSYVYPDDVLPNVEKLSGLVQDVEWVVFETRYGLPAPQTIARLAKLGQDLGHSYTVHLPLDMRLAGTEEAERRRSLDDARQVIETAAPLHPWAYVVHVLGEEPVGDEAAWLDRAAASLQALAGPAGGLERLAVENVPDYPAERLDGLLQRLGVSMTVDIGHLLRQGRDPLPVLQAHLARTRAIHLHGYEGGKDHRSLAVMDQGLLLRLLRTIHQARYNGVVTIELFGTQPFFDSWDLVEGLWRRIQNEAHPS